MFSVSAMICNHEFQTMTCYYPFYCAIWSHDHQKVCNPVIIWSGMARSAIFSIKVKCRTVSNALLKSRAITLTYWLVDSIEQTVWNRATNAAAVDPDGLNAY